MVDFDKIATLETGVISGKLGEAPRDWLEAHRSTFFGVFGFSPAWRLTRLARDQRAKVSVSENVGVVVAGRIKAGARFCRAGTVRVEAK